MFQNKMAPAYSPNYEWLGWDTLFCVWSNLLEILFHTNEYPSEAEKNSRVT